MDVAKSVQEYRVIAALELVPTRFRYSAVGIPNSLVTTLFGGTAPFVATALIAATGNPIAIAYYLIPASLLSLVTYVMMPETSRLEIAYNASFRILPSKGPL